MVERLFVLQRRKEVQFLNRFADPDNSGIIDYEAFIQRMIRKQENLSDEDSCSKTTNTDENAFNELILTPVEVNENGNLGKPGKVLLSGKF